MKPENLMCLENIFRRKSVEYGFQPPVKNSPRLISMAAPHEVFSLSLLLGDEVVVPPLPLKMSVAAVDGSFGVLIFPSPPILNPAGAKAALWLANEANQELYRGAALGRFWVDIEDLDFAYEVWLKEQMLEASQEETANQLFDVPLAHFHDLQIPLTMLARSEWDSSTALRYFRQLHENGFVNNEDYGLW